MKPEEQLLLALGDVGDDLIEESMHLRFPRAPWFRALPVAACCALILGAALLLQNLEPLRESQITLPEGEDTVQEVLPPDTETESTLRPFYVINLDDNIYGARQAVDQDGNVLVEVEQGGIYDLQDQTTGEIVAICALENQQVDTPSDSPVYLYDLQGELLTCLDVKSITCTGDLVALVTEEGASLYRRSDGSQLLAGQYRITLGDGCAVALESEDGPAAVYDSQGNWIAGADSPYALAVLSEEDGPIYVAIADEFGHYGLMDFTGTWVLDQVFDDISLLALNQVVAVRDGEFQVISLETGETVFTWPYQIHKLHAEGYVVENADGQWLAVDLTGRPVSDPADVIVLIDDEGDGRVELLQESYLDPNRAVFRRTDGTLVREVDLEGAEARVISSRTVAIWDWQGSATSWLLDLETGAENHDLGRVYWNPQRLNDYDEAVLLYAEYEDEDGERHADILNEAGAVVLADVNTTRGVTHLGDGVFVAYRNGKRVLARVDGTILYESDAPA